MRISHHNSVDKDIIRREEGCQLFRCVGPQECEKGKIVFPGYLYVNGKQVGALEKHPHMAVDVGWMDPHRNGSFNLGADFAFGFVGFDVLLTGFSLGP